MLREVGNVKRKSNLRFFWVILFLMLYWFAGTAIMSIFMNVNRKFADHYNEVASVVNVVIGFVVFILLFVFKKCITKFSVKSLISGLLVYGLPITIFCFYHIIISLKWILIEGFPSTVEQFRNSFFIIVIYYISVAFSEEIVFRSGFLEYLLPSSSSKYRLKVIFTCVYSGFLFGISHFISLFSEPEKGLDIIILTVVLGSCIGYVFSVIFLKTKNIVVTMLLHFLWDITTYCNSIMIEDKYRYGGSYNFIHYQIPIIIIMTAMVTFILCRSKVEELALN